MSNLEEVIKKHIDQLSRVIGPRQSGSVGNHAAANYIEDQMRRFGVDVERQTFACPDWRVEDVELTIAGRKIEALANAYSPSCDVTGDLVPASTIAELELADLSGRIAFLYGDLTRQPIACKSWFLKEERDVRIVSLLEEKAPLAVLTVQGLPNSVIRLIEDQEFSIPSATLPNESALYVANHLTEKIHLRIKTRQQEGETANLVGRIPGKRPEVVVLCAHYDTKIDTPGAGDNAAGVAALLALAETLAGTALEVGVELIAFTNEEYLPIGDEAYLEGVGADHLNDILLAVNFDGLGHILDANSLAIYTSSAEFQSEVEEIKLGFPAFQWVEPWPQSNHSTFSWRGVPALAISSQLMSPYSHQHYDTADWVSPARVAEAVRLVTEVIKTVENRPGKWLRSALEK